MLENQVDIAAMLMEMRCELEELKRKSIEEVENLRQENSSLKRKSAKRELDNTSLEKEDTNVSMRPAPSKHTLESQCLTQSYHITPSSARRHSFTDEIMEVPLPLNWRNSMFEMYDETTNSDEHLDVYTTQVGLFTLEDVILYRVFPTSLKGSVLRWFTQLPPFLIDNF